jgi:hypothetical protein
METVILSESMLAKDWLSPEEEEAWKNWVFAVLCV